MRDYYMTVAVILCPIQNIQPFIITDTILSDQCGSTIGPLAIRNRNMDHYLDDLGSYYSGESMARKCVINEGLTAIAFAGNVYTIRDFLKNNRVPLSSYGKQRPLKELAETVSLYRKEDLNSICALVDQEKGGIQKIRPAYAPEYEVDGVAYFSAIGSGSEDAINTIMELTWPSPNDQSDSNICNIIAETMCSQSVFREIYNESQSYDHEDSTWGGIYEYVMFDPIRMEWTRKPSSIYFIYESTIDLDQGVSNPKLIDRQIAYEPGTIDGWISVIRRNKSNRYNAVYKLKSIDPSPRNDPEINWNEWRPSRVNLILAGIIKKNGEDHGSIWCSRFFDIDDFNDVESCPSESGPHFLPYGEEHEEFLIEGKKFLSDFLVDCRRKTA